MKNVCIYEYVIKYEKINKNSGILPPKPLQFAINLSLGLHTGRPSCIRSLHLQKRISSTSKHEISLFFILFLWVIFALLDPKPDTESGYRIRIWIQFGPKTLVLMTMLTCSGEIYSYVATEVQTGFSSFSLSTSFPR